MRVALIHAMQESIEPIRLALAREFPQAQPFDLLDSALAVDRAAGGPEIEAELDRRFLALTDYAIALQAGAVLFTCSAFGRQIDLVGSTHPGLIVRKPNEAMIRSANRYARIGLVASFEPTLHSMAQEFEHPERLRLILAKGALDALRRGDGAQHDALVCQAASEHAEQVDCFALAQFSIARAAPLLELRYARPVLTTPAMAARDLFTAMAGGTDPGAR
ncbi:arylsulfatase [Blastomonas sp.]|uniref:arylsulfatase n=1 Tax=Blastomonas sp. TaxID=1909299 RepID=UPI00260753C1|nr:arylsulfatase [Blastomonas sp.]MDM7955771.1 arylsulfatase [Blastomonas sp.]